MSVRTDIFNIQNHLNYMNADYHDLFKLDIWGRITSKITFDHFYYQNYSILNVVLTKTSKP